MFDVASKKAAQSSGKNWAWRDRPINRLILFRRAGAALAWGIGAICVYCTTGPLKGLLDDNMDDFST